MAIINKFEEFHKRGSNYLIKHGYITLGYLKSGVSGQNPVLFVIDGQHRYAAMQKLEREYGYEGITKVLIRYQKYESIRDMQDDFILLNTNSNMPLLYTQFENQFLRNTLLKLKEHIKCVHIGAFSKNFKPSPQTNRMHIDEFMQLFDENKMKILYNAHNKPFDDHKWLIQRVSSVNNSIMNHIKMMTDINENVCFVKVKDNVLCEANEFYASLRNINFNAMFFDEKPFEMKSISHKKKTIPKKIKEIVLNRDFGIEKNIGKCYACKCELFRKDVIMGHVLAEYNGGDCSANNLRCVCGDCNSSMQTLHMQEYIRRYYPQNEQIRIY